MHLFSVLSNFEPPQLAAYPGHDLRVAARSKPRADLQEDRRAKQVALIERCQAGETVKALAAKFGMHHQTVRALLEAAGVSVRTRQRLTTHDQQQIRDLYEAGHTTTEIGDQFGVYSSTVRRQLIKLGVRLRVPGRQAR